MIDCGLVFNNSMLTMYEHNDTITKGGQSFTIQDMFMLEETLVLDAFCTR